MAVLVIHPAVELANANRRDASPSTSKKALDWIVANVQPGNRIVVDPTTLITRDNTRLEVDDRFSPRTDTLGGYREARFDYLVISGLRAGQYRSQRERYRHETAFYRSIACHTRLVAAFRTTTSRRGVAVRIYRLDTPPSPDVFAFCSAAGLAS